MTKHSTSTQPDTAGFDLDPIFRMPSMLGPAPGPRNMPKSKEHLRYKGENTTIAVRALTDEKALTRLMPPRCRLAGDPVLAVALTMLTNLGWLAGRGYNILRVSCEVIFDGAAGPVHGNLQLAMWENHADPILTGREELGTPKLFANLPNARFVGDRCDFAADWEGFRFAELEVDGLKQVPINPPKQYPAQGGLPLLCYRYHLVVGDWQKPGIAAMTRSTPGNAPAPVVREQLSGAGRYAFFTPRWEDMPTQYPFVATLSALPLIEFRSASVTRASGIADLAAMVTLD